MSTPPEGFPPDGGNAADTGRTRTRSTEPKATGQAASMAHEAVDRAADSAAKAEERLREAALAGEERLREKGAEARMTAERALDHMRQYTRDNPFAAAGIAFAAGMILSRLLRR
ncbi:MAG TPA: hypothetical protein VF329_13720 [Gammaproteobacteria bacterium]